ncbi:IS200/IS605 family transposase [Sutterella megalosphaeroides]|uniref:Transposase n=1 Tax=Sutterella megalosphaeroides TaxID=2494234 RepID=A0A2Z6IEF0_9BURK|nr:IS200/IS605 family transposase [Sutterella megalosphaeroides]BBF23066.1 transposase [Sutterella megalosphaeroides]
MFDDYDKRRHSVTKLCVHLVFTTKYRRKVMTPPILEEMKVTLRETAEKIGCTVKEINGEEDHIHLLLLFPADMSISSMVNSLKTVSSRMIRKNHPNILHGGNTGLFWSRSYFAATAGGVTVDVLKRYVESQGTRSRHSSPPLEGEGS